MQSLIIPAVILLLIGLWGAWESGRKFRREFQRRGKAWEDVCAAVKEGKGRVVVDSVWGPQRGLGHPTIWWLPAVADGAGGGEGAKEIGPRIENPAGDALLVRCPRSLKNLEALRAKFGAPAVLAHSWDIAPPITASASQTP